MGKDEVDQPIGSVLDQMKAEHDQLVQTVQDIRHAIETKDVDRATKLLMQLQIHQQAHFDHEMAVMQRCRYPAAAEHEASHEGLIDVLHNIYRLISLENLQQLSGELAEYLEDSLNHIIEVDRPLQDFLLSSKDDGS